MKSSTEKIGMLTPVSRAGSDRFGRALWNCQCECGNECVVAMFRLKSGHTKSCGCRRGKNAKHGMRNSKTYNSWMAMKARCTNPNNENYPEYGGRGIVVCERWMESFEAFLEDMGERPEGMTIDRMDPLGNYEPSNCRWATDHDQQRNRRSTIMVERNGVTKCIKDWCDELGLKPDVVYGRIRRGKSPEEALQ